MKARRWRRVDGGETSKESSTRDCRRRIITEETTPEGSPTEERRRRKTSSKGTSLEERRRGNVVVGISSWEFSSEGRQRKSDNNRNRKWSRGNETGAEKKLGFETVLRLRNCVTSSKRGSVSFASIPDTTLPRYDSYFSISLGATPSPRLLSAIDQSRRRKRKSRFFDGQSGPNTSFKRLRNFICIVIILRRGRSLDVRFMIENVYLS